MIALALGLFASACFVVFMVHPVPRCGCGSTYRVMTRRRMTSYADDSMNFTTGCEACFDDEQAYWAERWDEYYAGCM